MRYNDGLPIELAGEDAFQIGPILVEPALRRISSAGEAVELLEPRIMQVLVVLAHASVHGGIVSREELVRQCWNDRITTRDSINRVISLLRQIVRRHSNNEVTIETLAKVGYRLSVPASALTPEPAPPAPEPPVAPPAATIPPVPAPARKGWWGTAVLGLVAAAPIAAAAIWQYEQAASPPAPPVIAVLPFKAEGGNADDQIFAEGLSEDVMNGLAEDPRIRVIGRTTAQRLDQTPTLRNTAHDRLGISKLLIGKVDYGQDRKSMTVRVQLVDSRTQQPEWEKSVRLGEPDVPAAGSTLVSQVAWQLLGAAGGRRDSMLPDRLDPGAYRRIVKARVHIQSREGNRLIEARELAREATEISPQWAEAHAVRSIAASLMQNYTDVPMAPLQAEAGAAAARALSLDPRSPAAHDAQSLALEGIDVNLTMAAAGRAVLLRPGSAEARRRLAWLLRNEGQYRQAAAELEMAIRIDPLWYLPYIDLGMALAQTDEAARLIALQARHAALNPPAGERDLVLANILFDSGRAGEAATIAGRLVRTEPQLTYAALTWIDSLVALFAVSSIPVDLFELNTSPVIVALARGNMAAAARIGERSTAIEWSDPELQVATGYALLAEGAPQRLRALHMARNPASNAGSRGPGPVLAMGRHPDLYAAQAFALVGDKVGAAAMGKRIALDVARLERLGLSKSQSGLTMAALALMQGRRGQALDRLEASMSARWALVCHGPIWIGTDPLFTGLAGEPRFNALLTRCRNRLDGQRKAAGLGRLPPAPAVPGRAGPVS